MKNLASGPPDTTLIRTLPSQMKRGGILDLGDINTFVQLFLAGDLSADFNGDTILDPGDIWTFVNLYLAGC